VISQETTPCWNNSRITLDKKILRKQSPTGELQIFINCRKIKKLPLTRIKDMRNADKISALKSE
jgi:hypothetical protein